MTVYKAQYVGDVWAMAILGGDKPTLVTTTSMHGPDDLDEVFAWMTEQIGVPREQLHYVGVGADRNGHGEGLYVGTDEDEFVAGVAADAGTGGW